MRRSILALCVTMAPAAVQAANPTITVTGGKHDLTNVVITVPVPKTPIGQEVDWARHLKCRAQVSEAPLLASDTGPHLTFVLSELKAGATVTLAESCGKSPGPKYRWVERPGEHIDLVFDGRPVLRYVHTPHDPMNHFLTMKVFHHVFDPATGKLLLTSGAHPQSKEYLYPHHRGLFYGFNNISYPGQKKVDVWHGTAGAYQGHNKVLMQEAGEVLGRHRLAIGWHGPDGQAFANEEREVTAYAVPGGTLIDFATVLRTELPKVRLDGDPQHAGFHFRAAQEVAKKTKAQTYYLRPDGKGEPGQTRNWDAKTRDPKAVNLPWNAMSFVAHGKRYTVLYLDHPANPKEARSSERDYGRFGSYFEYDLTPQKPLKVRYRVWVQEGEMTKEECESLHRAFVDPPAVTAAE